MRSVQHLGAPQGIFRGRLGARGAGERNPHPCLLVSKLPELGRRRDDVLENGPLSRQLVTQADDG